MLSAIGNLRVPVIEKRWNSKVLLGAKGATRRAAWRNSVEQFGTTNNTDNDVHHRILTGKQMQPTFTMGSSHGHDFWARFGGRFLIQNMVR